MKKAISLILRVLLITMSFVFIVHEAKANEYDQIVKDEGLVLEVYEDTLGLPTIGYGHLLKKDEHYTTITKEFALELLRVDYKEALNYINIKYPWAEGEAQNVLINMRFQLGDNLNGFVKFLSAMEDKNYLLAYLEMYDSLWAVQTPNRTNRLANRVLGIYLL